MKKLFLVSVELEVPVWAESPEEAARIAKRERAFEDDLLTCSEPDFAAVPASRDPVGGDDEDFVYGGSGLKLRQALEATPEYVAARERLAAIRGKTANHGGARAQQ